jgi:hypothetical protein
MNDMNDMTTVLDQHVQAVLNQPVDDLFTYKASGAAPAKEKPLPALNQRSRNVARTMPAFGH